MKKVLFINFGHASTPVEATGVDVDRIDIVVQLADPSDPQEITQKAIELATGVAGKIAEASRDGKIVVVGLPGASGIAAALVLALQGLLGYAPLAVVGTRRNGGFVYDLNRAIDLTEIRDKARLFRGEYGL